MTRRLWAVGLLGLLLAGAAAGWWWWRSAPPAPPEVPLADVEEQIAAAIRVARARVEAAPRSAEAWGHLGRLLYTHNFLPQARECFAHAERLDRREPAYPYLQGICLAPEAPAEAEACYRRALALADAAGDRDQTIRLRLVELLLADGRLDDAERELAAAERKADDRRQQHRARFNRGLLAARRRQWPHALELLSPLASEPALRLAVAPHLALVCRQAGKPELAAQYGDLAADADQAPAWPDRYVESCTELNVGWYARFQRLKDLEQKQGGAAVLPQLEELSRQRPRDAQVFHALAGVQYRLGNFEASDRALRRVIELAPGQYRYHHTRAAVLYEWAEQARRRGEDAAGRFEEALREARRAMALSPRDGHGLLLLARCQAALGQDKEARATLAEAVAIRPEAAPVHLLLGEVLDRLGEAEQALAHLERAVKLAPPGDPAPAEALKRFRDKRDK